MITNRVRLLLIAVILLQLLLGSITALTLPLWEGHESDYYTVTRFLVTEHRLPTAADYPDGDAEIRQATQPPLYFFAAAPLIALLDDGQPVPYGLHPLPLCPGADPSAALTTVHSTDRAYNQPTRGTVAAGYALRLLNVIFGAVTVLFTFLAARVMFPRTPLIALLAAALIAFEPVTARFVVTISNDALLLAVCAALIWMSARVLTRPRLSGRDLVVLLALALAAPLIKLPGWAALALAIFVLVYRVITAAQYRRILLIGLAAVLVITAAIALFNQAQYGSVLGRYAALGGRLTSLERILNIPPVVITSVIAHTLNDLRAPLNALQPRAAFANAYALMLITAWIGAWIGAIWAIAIARQPEQRRAFLLVCATIVITLIMVILRNTFNANAENTTAYNTAMIFAPLRYYTPGIPAAAILIAAGLGVFLPRVSQRAAAVIPVGAFAFVSLISAALLLIARPNITLTAAQFDALENIQRLSPPDSQAPRILGYQLASDPDAGVFDLTLYAALDVSTALNYVGDVSLMGASGCEFIPARGEYPTPRWEADQIVRLDVRIPYCAAGWDADTRLYVAWHAYAPDRTPLDSTIAVPLDVPLTPPLTTAASCPPNLGVIDQRFQLLKWNSPESIQRGELYLPSVNWLVLEASAPPLTRLFRFVHTESGTEYGCSGSPSGGQIPISGWQRGETVYFDQCQMRFPVDAPPGDYRVYTGMQTLSGEMLPASAASESAEAERGWLLTGQIHVNPAP